MNTILNCLIISLFLFIGSSSAYNRKVFKDFRLKQKQYSILARDKSTQGHDSNVICQSAKCDYKSNTVYNVVNPDCGNYYTCQECPPSFGLDICYLGITSPDWTNVTEGHLNLWKNDRVFRQSKEQAKPSKKNSEDDFDDLEEGFIEQDSYFDSELGSSFVEKYISTQSFKYTDHHDEKWLLNNKRSCQIGPDGSIELSVRLIMQYFKTASDQSQDASNPNGDESFNSYSDHMFSTIQLEESSGSMKDSSSDDSDGSSMVQLGFSFHRGDDDDDDMDGLDSGGGNVFAHMAKKGLKFSAKKGASLKNSISSGIKFLYQKAQVMMNKPQIHIHFVVDDIRLKSCRQPLSWSGDMTSNAMIFVGNQNFRVDDNVLDSDFLKKSIRVNATVKGVFELSFNSCIQIHCTKRQPFQIQYMPPPLPVSPSGPKFSISRKLMGLTGDSHVPPNAHQHVLVTPNLPNLNASNNSVPINLHNAPQPETIAKPPSGPVTNIPSFNNTTQPSTPTAPTPAITTPSTASIPEYQDNGLKVKKKWVYVAIGVIVVFVTGTIIFLKR